jgi:hypothetical protein
MAIAVDRRKGHRSNSVRDYFSAILPGLADLPIQRLPKLTPGSWAATKA